MRKSNLAQVLPMEETCPDKHEVQHDHIHAANCGHKSVVHEDHIDYIHDGHFHHMHDSHVDKCTGPKKR